MRLPQTYAEFPEITLRGNVRSKKTGQANRFQYSNKNFGSACILSLELL